MHNLFVYVSGLYELENLMTINVIAVAKIRLIFTEGRSKPKYVMTGKVTVRSNLKKV